MKRNKSKAEQVPPVEQDFLHAAADRVGPLLHTAADRVAPLAQNAADRIAPLSSTARDRVSPLAAGAAGFVAPYAAQAAGVVGPYAQSARERGSKAAHDAVERLQPSFDGARDRVTPAVAAARDKINDELLPLLTAALDAAAASPVLAEATKRGKATLAAAKGELALVEEQPVRRWPQRLAIVAGLAGVAYVGARKFLGSKDADWQAARPTAPYTPAKAPTSAGTGLGSNAASAPVHDEALADQARGGTFGEGSRAAEDTVPNPVAESQPPGADAAAAAEAAAAGSDDSALSKFDAAVEAPNETKRYSASDPITVLADDHDPDSGDRH